MLGKHKKIKEESLQAFKFNNIISKKLLFSQTYCDIYLITLINDKAEYIMKEIAFESKAREDEIKKEIFLHKKMSTTVEKPKGFMNFYGYVLIEDLNTMEKTFYLFFDSTSDSLETVLKKKQSAKTRFSFQEIYCTFRILLNCFTYLQLRGLRHGKISSQNIFCDYEGEQLSFSSIKVCDISSVDTEKIQTKSIINKDVLESEIKYLSPEMRNVEINKDFNIFKVDVFALGVLLLELGTFGFPLNLQLKDGEYYFIETNDLANELNIMFKEMRKFFKTKIKPVETKKFEFFMNLLWNMLSLDTQIRPDFLELYKSAIFMSEEDIINHMLIEEKRFITEGLFFSIEK